MSYIFDYSQYKKSINKKNNFGFTILFLLIIFFFSLCVFLFPKGKNYNEYYFVEIDNFQTYKEANKLAQSITERGGAGYVYFDGTYHVLASLYSNEKNAEKVCENLKNEFQNSTVFTVSCKQFIKQKNLTSKQNSSIENVINVTKKLILQIEDLSTKFITEDLSFQEVQILIKNHHKTFSSALDEFISNFKSNSKFNLAKTYLEEINKSFSTITKSEEQNFSPLLRYEVISITISLTQFSSSL